MRLRRRACLRLLLPLTSPIAFIVNLLRPPSSVPRIATRGPHPEGHDGALVRSTLAPGHPCLLRPRVRPTRPRTSWTSRSATDASPDRGIAERAEHDRGTAVRDAGGADRLEHIAIDLAALRSDLAALTQAQATVHSDFRDHIVRSALIGDVHASDWSRMQLEVAETAQRVRTVEDSRVRMRTYGTILRLTFGVSIVGAVAGIIGLVNMFAALGR